MGWVPTKKMAARQAELAKPLAARDIHNIPSVKDFIKEHGTTFVTISKTRATAAYREAFTHFTKKQARVLGAEFKEITLEVKGKLREASNEAVTVLWNIMNDDKEKAPARVSAAVELLDRDGRFAKVSRLMNVREGADGAPMLPEDAASEILDALDAAKHGRPN